MAAEAIPEVAVAVSLHTLHLAQMGTRITNKDTIDLSTIVAAQVSQARGNWQKSSLWGVGLISLASQKSWAQEVGLS